MNIVFKRVLSQALFASFAAAGLAANATDTQTASAEPADAKTLVQLCAASPNGMVPRAQVVKALNRMLDMGETPEAAKMDKQKRRERQFQAFWNELARESFGG